MKYVSLTFHVYLQLPITIQLHGLMHTVLPQLAALSYLICYAHVVCYICIGAPYVIMLLCQLFHHAYLVSYMTTYSLLCHVPISLGLPVDYLQSVIDQCLEFICLATLPYLPCLPYLYLSSMHQYFVKPSMPTSIMLCLLCPRSLCLLQVWSPCALVFCPFLYIHLRSYIVQFILSSYYAYLQSNMLPWILNLCLTSLEYIASYLVYYSYPSLLCITILIVFYVVQSTLPYWSAQLTYHNMNTFNIIHDYLVSQPTKYSSECPMAFYIHLVSLNQKD